jgi:hypothetical protein
MKRKYDSDIEILDDEDIDKSKIDNYRIPKLDELKLNPKEYYDPPGDHYCGYHVMERLGSYLNAFENYCAFFNMLGPKQKKSARIAGIWANSTDFDNFVQYIYENYNEKIFIQCYDENNIPRAFHSYIKKKIRFNNRFLHTQSKFFYYQFKW